MNHTFGIEIEVTGHTQATIRKHLNEAGLTAWKVVRDGSVSGSSSRSSTTCTGNEVVSPVLSGADGLAQVEKAIKALRKAGCRVNTTCGIHVHFGARDFTLAEMKNICKNYVRYERAFDAVVAPSRRGIRNRYCYSPLFNTTGVDQDWNHAQTESEEYRTMMRIQTQGEAALFTKIENAQTIAQVHGAFNSCAGHDYCGGEHYSTCRYYKLNLHSYARIGTIEFRQHQGSLNAEKVLNWIKLLDNFVTFAKGARLRRCVKVYTSMDLMRTLCERAGCSDLYEGYFKARILSLRKEGEAENGEAVRT